MTESIYYEHHHSNDNAATLVFLHDSLGCTALWRDFPAALAELSGCNYFLYDRLGYGRSKKMDGTPRSLDYLEIEADRLVDLLGVHNLTQVILFGHSDGGSIALIAASKYPDRFQSIITEGAHVFVEPITLEGIKNAKSAYRTTSLRQKLLLYHQQNTDLLFDAWVDTWLNPAFLKWDITHLLPRITCPSLVLQGVADAFGTVRQVDAIVDGIGTPAQKVMLENCGHSPHKEATVQTIKIVQTFLAALNK